MTRTTTTTLLLATGLLLAAAGLVDASRLSLSKVPKNMSGYLVTKGSGFYFKPIYVDEREIAARFNKTISSGLSGPTGTTTTTTTTTTTSSASDENWIDDIISGLAEDSTEDDENERNVDGDGDDDDDDDDDLYEDYEDDGVSWLDRRRSTTWLMSKARARGFSFFGMVESAVGYLGKFLGNIIGSEDDEDYFFEDDFYDDVQDSGKNSVSYKDHQLIRLTPKTKRQVKYLIEMKDNEPDDVKFWTSPAKNKVTDMVVSPIILNDVKSFLREKKIAYTILISDLQKAITTQNPRMPKQRRQEIYSSQGHSMDWKRYHRYKEIMGYLDYLKEKYPHLVEIESIGKSFEGRDLMVAKISTGVDKNGEPKPSIWIDAGMHAREWISTAVATYILNQLVEKHDNYTRLLDVTDWIIMPVANPDGYEYTHTHDRLWRKTRSTHDASSDGYENARQAPGLFHMLSHYTKWLFGSCEGVDANRNFNIHWGEEKVGGASSDPCHDTYAGPRAFSEPETRAISEFLMENRKNIRTYLTLHSYSQMLLVPWGFTRTRPADFNELMNIANKAKQAIHKVHKTEYRVGPAAELLYPTTGSSDDWAKAVAGIKHAYTMELRDRGAYGFLLPASQIMPTARETWAGVRVIARMGANSSAN
ncbi:carboxypeptidase A2-like [Trichogramma pretiosum]|uniref:carboxypeptidase A2-like n=1 Tax=Trichogramma pretiosum TaxID=7493 RepID=UPI0006C9A6FD|nr:carboxypeptidase A2-like [Trichogramma pretiosum]